MIMVNIMPSRITVGDTPEPEAKPTIFAVVPV